MDPEQVRNAYRQAAERAARSGARVDRRIQPLLPGGVPTFIDAPPVHLGHLGEPDVAVLGVPFEGVTTKDPLTFVPRGAAPAPSASDHYHRSGADRAPAAIRRGSTFNSLLHSNGWLPEYRVALGERLDIVDAGDVQLDHLGEAEAAVVAAEAVAEVARTGAVPLVLGGDHTVSGFVLDGLHRADTGRVGVIVYDSHLDLTWEPRIWAGSQWGRAFELGAVEPANLVQIGIRGTRNAVIFEEVARELGVTYFTIPDVDERGIREVTESALELALAGVDRLYISLDVDVLDPAFCPAQKYPDSGGLTAREVFSSIRTAVAAAPALAGFDICCLGPAYDLRHAGAVCAARAALEVLGGLALKAAPPVPAATAA
jgi:arginase family enzyme